MKNTMAVILATTAAGLLSAAPIVQAENSATTTAVHCYGVNSCKSTNGCKANSASCKGINSCKGMNSCKGKGYIVISQAQCSKMGGSTAPLTKESK